MPIFIEALFAIDKIWKQSKCLLTDEWIREICVYIDVCVHIHTHNGIVLSHKKNEMLLKFYPKDPQGSLGHCGGTSNPSLGSEKICQKS